jgi:hypothetical protein
MLSNRTRIWQMRSARDRHALSMLVQKALHEVGASTVIGQMLSANGQREFSSLHSERNYDASSRLTLSMRKAGRTMLAGSRYLV